MSTILTRPSELPTEMRSKRNVPLLLGRVENSLLEGVLVYLINRLIVTYLAGKRER